MLVWRCGSLDEKIDFFCPLLSDKMLLFVSFLFLILDYDPQVIEQKEQSRPTCLPLSYVLRFITDAARREGPFLGTSGAELKRKLAIKHHSYSMSSSNRSNTPTGDFNQKSKTLITE